MRIRAYTSAYVYTHMRVLVYASICKYVYVNAIYAYT